MVNLAFAPALTTVDKKKNMHNMIPLPHQFLSAVMIGLCLVSSGQYKVRSTSIELKDTTRGNRKITADIWYPAVSHQSRSGGVEERNEKFPVICFAHGYLHPGDRYGNLVGILVPAGYIMVNLTTNEGLFPSHRGYAENIRFLADVITDLGTDTLSPLFGKEDTLICLMGHSLGGGASFIAAAGNRAVDAIVALTPYEFRPSAIDAASRVSVPTLIFSGTSDCITSPRKNHLPMYERSAAQNKTYISIINGSHCGMGDSRKCFIAERLAGCRNGLGTDEQTLILARYLIPWLNSVLKGDSEQEALFNRTLTTDDEVTWQRSKPLYDCYN